MAGPTILSKTLSGDSDKFRQIGFRTDKYFNIFNLKIQDMVQPSSYRSDFPYG